MSSTNIATRIVCCFGKPKQIIWVPSRFPPVSLFGILVVATGLCEIRLGKIWVNLVNRCTGGRCQAPSNRKKYCKSCFAACFAPCCEAYPTMKPSLFASKFWLSGWEFRKPTMRERNQTGRHGCEVLSHPYQPFAPFPPPLLIPRLYWTEMFWFICLSVKRSSGGYISSGTPNPKA